MTTHELAQHLATAAETFAFLGEITPRKLLDLVRCELGDEEILDDFRPYGGHFAMAAGPATILHVVSADTSHAGLQSLIRGLLLKSHNLCKVPFEGLPEIDEFHRALPPELASRVEIARELPADWLDRADAVVVFGNDETIEHFQQMARSHQRFVAHGHKISFGIVFDDPAWHSVAHAARDASLFDQQGCLLPHAFYIRETAAFTARGYAEKLAAAMDAFNRHTPRGKISESDAAAIENLRNSCELRAANDPDVQVWKSRRSTDWTVIFETDAMFRRSCLNRVIFVKPLPPNLAPAVAQVRPRLSTIAIWPPTLENARLIHELGATRICPIGKMQSPPFTWHQNGGQNLAPLVRWIDFENR
jgi:acyl-CoA reductase LuxC